MWWGCKFHKSGGANRNFFIFLIIYTTSNSQLFSIILVSFHKIKKLLQILNSLKLLPHPIEIRNIGTEVFNNLLFVGAGRHCHGYTVGLQWQLWKTNRLYLAPLFLVLLTSLMCAYLLTLSLLPHSLTSQKKSPVYRVETYLINIYKIKIMMSNHLTLSIICDALKNNDPYLPCVCLVNYSSFLNHCTLIYNKFISSLLILI